MLTLQPAEPPFVTVSTRLDVRTAAFLDQLAAKHRTNKSSVLREIALLVASGILPVNPPPESADARD